MSNRLNIGAYVKRICYTKEEVDAALLLKANAVHSHNNEYYTKNEIDTKITEVTNNLSDLNTEIITELENKSPIDHNHDSEYASLSHTHTKADITDFNHTHPATSITYGQSTVDSMITSLNTAVNDLQTANWDIEIVTELPTVASAKVGKLYFVHNESEDDIGGNSFDEYIFTGGENGKFEKIGQRKIDLSNYVTDVNMSFDEGILSVVLTKGEDTFNL